MATIVIHPEPGRRKSQSDIQDFQGEIAILAKDSIFWNPNLNAELGGGIRLR